MDAEAGVAERGRYIGRVIWITSANTRYAVDGIRPGTSIKTATAHLNLSSAFAVGTKGRVRRCRLDHRRAARGGLRAWTEPDQIRQWWGPGEFTCPKAEVDLRPGGSYRLAMQPTAGEAFIVGGTYREVEPPTRLVYTWRWEMGPAADGSESLVMI